ncbi:MAG: hypothetical protein JW934_01045 [Anaerolineae bacterium]|nr:hypothetical protein [Anaerolineae bacterium]
MNLNVAGTLVAFVLTLMVYAYLIKDISFFYSLYRIAAYLFVGVALGYAAVMAWHGVLVPRLLLQLEEGRWWYLVPLIFCLLLLAKVRPAWSKVGNIPIAFMLGVGAALAVGGGVIGTLIPQVEATFVSLNPLHYQGQAAAESSYVLVYVLEALLMVVGTVSTLLYFYFNTEGGSRRLAGVREPILRLSTGFGKVFMMFTFGAIFATTAISRLSLLADRIRFLILTVWSWIPTP